MVWVHLQREHFPPRKFFKLQPKVDGPFKVIQQVGDNAYKIDLPNNYSVSTSFNVFDFFPTMVKKKIWSTLMGKSFPTKGV